MTTRVHFNTVWPLNTARTQEPAAAGYKGMKAKVLLPALLGCLTWLPFSSAAEAAPFQVYKNGLCSSSSSICNIELAIMATGRLEITNVSCYLRTSETADLLAMQLLVTEGTATRTAVTLRPASVAVIGTTGEEVFSANHAISAFASAGHAIRAFAELKTGTFKQFACHISGQVQTVS